jgi:antitoxin (DNA-binding transcriptional repressor) of toxin-antitoxin stability system
MTQVVNNPEVQCQDTIVDDAKPMRTVNMHEAKTELSKLVEKAAAGAFFIVAKAGKPMVKVTTLDAPLKGQVRRIGLMAGLISVPDDFDRTGSAEIARLSGDETV